MNKPNNTNAAQNEVITTATLTLPLNVREMRAKRRLKWSRRVIQQLNQHLTSKLTIIIVIPRKKKRHMTSSITAPLLHCPKPHCKVTKAVSMAQNIDRSSDPLRTLMYGGKCSKDRVWLESIYR